MSLWRSSTPSRVSKGGVRLSIVRAERSGVISEADEAFAEPLEAVGLGVGQRLDLLRRRAQPLRSASPSVPALARSTASRSRSASAAVVRALAVSSRERAC